MRQLRCLVPMDRPHDKRQAARTVPKTAVVRAACGPLLQTRPAPGTDYQDSYNTLHEPFCTALVLHPYGNPLAALPM